MARRNSGQFRSVRPDTPVLRSPHAAQEFAATGEYSLFGLAIADESRVISGRRIGFTASLFGAATLLAVLCSVERYMYGIVVGPPMPMAQLIPAELAVTYLWVLLTPLVMWSVRRFPLSRHGSRRNWLVQLGSAHAFIVLHVAGFTGASVLLGYQRQLSIARSFGAYFIAWFFVDLIVFCLLITVYHAVVYYRISKDRATRGVHLEASLARSQLRALRVQLHPHFLFNTMNSISALMHQDVNRADAMMTALGDLLRMSLRTADIEEVRVREEVDVLNRYLEIMVLRFGDRLRADVQVEGDALDAGVPSLILQPIVENAIQHGFGDARTRCEVLVSIARRGEMLVCRIRDNGRGLPAHGFREGIGLSNTRARLRHLYGDDHQLDLDNDPRGGTCVTVILPFRTAGLGVAV